MKNQEIDREARVRKDRLSEVLDNDYDFFHADIVEEGMAEKLRLASTARSHLPDILQPGSLENYRAKAGVTRAASSSPDLPPREASSVPLRDGVLFHNVAHKRSDDPKRRANCEAYLDTCSSMEVPFTPFFTAEEREMIRSKKTSKRALERKEYAVAAHKLSLKMKESTMGLPLAPVTRLMESSSDTHASLHHQNIGSKGCFAVAEFLRTNHLLEHFQLENIGAMDAGCIAIAEALKENTALTSLDLNTNGITCKGASALAASIRLNKNIKCLFLKDNAIKDGFFTTLLQKEDAYDVSLEVLDVSKNKIGLHGISALAAAMSQLGNSFRELNLSWNAFGDIGATVVINGLFHGVEPPAWETVNLEKMHAEAQVVKAARAAGDTSYPWPPPLPLQNHTIISRLTSLELAFNGLCDTTGVKLAIFLAKDHYMKRLDISHNNVGELTALAFAQALRENEKLEHLKLGFNGLGTCGTLALIESLEHNEVVVSLLLENTTHAGDEVKAIYATEKSLRVRKHMAHVVVEFPQRYRTKILNKTVPSGLKGEAGKTPHRARFKEVDPDRPTPTPPSEAVPKEDKQEDRLELVGRRSARMTEFELERGDDDVTWEDILRVTNDREMQLAVSATKDSKGKGRKATTLELDLSAASQLNVHWTLEASVFGERKSATLQGFYETSTSVDKLFRSDWMNTNINEIIPNPRQTQQIRKVLALHFKSLKNVHICYCTHHDFAHAHSIEKRETHTPLEKIAGGRILSPEEMTKFHCPFIMHMDGFLKFCYDFQLVSDDCDEYYLKSLFRRFCSKYIHITAPNANEAKAVQKKMLNVMYPNGVKQSPLGERLGDSGKRSLVVERKISKSPGSETGKSEENNPVQDDFVNFGLWRHQFICVLVVIAMRKHGEKSNLHKLHAGIASVLAGVKANRNVSKLSKGAGTKNGLLSFAKTHHHAPIPPTLPKTSFMSAFLAMRDLMDKHILQHAAHVGDFDVFRRGQLYTERVDYCLCLYKRKLVESFMAHSSTMNYDSDDDDSDSDSDGVEKVIDPFEGSALMGFAENEEVPSGRFMTLETWLEFLYEKIPKLKLYVSTSTGHRRAKESMKVQLAERAAADGVDTRKFSRHRSLRHQDTMFENVMTKQWSAFDEPFRRLHFLYVQSVSATVTNEQQEPCQEQQFNKFFAPKLSENATHLAAPKVATSSQWQSELADCGRSACLLKMGNQHVGGVNSLSPTPAATPSSANIQPMFILCPSSMYKATFSDFLESLCRIADDSNFWAAGFMANEEVQSYENLAFRLEFLLQELYPDGAHEHEPQPPPQVPQVAHKTAPSGGRPKLTRTGRRFSKKMSPAQRNRRNLSTSDGGIIE
jgi:Ran GTPase-activating protein (RanGAP) involved in mRNA processing and transport